MSRTLPHNLDAEKSVLGAVLVNHHAFDDIAHLLTPETFFREAHGRIFRKMTELHQRNTPVDLITLMSLLDRAGELDEVGGASYLTALTDGVPRSMNTTYYAKIVAESALHRALIRVGTDITSRAYDTEEDATAILARADQSLLEIQRSGHLQAPVHLIGGDASTLLQTIQTRAEHPGQLLGLDTGFTAINDLTLGWQAGEMIVIAARPSIGKTVIVMNTVVAAALNGKRAAVFSFEMRVPQLEHRILSSLSGVPAQRLRTGFLTDADYERFGPAWEKFSRLNIKVLDRSRQTVHDIRHACRRMRHDGGLDLVAIDYVQLVPGSLERRGVNRNDEMTEISHRLKDLAEELRVPILVVSQLNRASDKRPDKRPLLSDLRESGTLEQDADIVAFLHRSHHRKSGPTAFILDKQRNGPTGTVMLSIDRETQTFTEAAREEAQEETLRHEPDHEEAPDPPRSTRKATRSKHDW